MNPRALSGLCFLSVLLGLQAQAAAPTVALQIGAQRIEVETATTMEQRAVGLMHRTHLAQDSGMLFEFEPPEVTCFWMKNTLIPLSIAFVADGRIIDIQSMTPLSTQAHCPPAPIDQALEMNEGWFDRHGIGPGSAVTLALP